MVCVDIVQPSLSNSSGNMQVFIITFLYALVCACSTLIYPILNKGDVTVKEVTDRSALLVWNSSLVSEYNNTFALRLLLYVEMSRSGGNLPMLMTPNVEDPTCSLSVSQCHLEYLAYATNYSITLTIDEFDEDLGTTSDILGEATVQFQTKDLEEHINKCPVSDGDPEDKWSQLEVILPVSAAFIALLIAVSCVAVCLWKKRATKGQCQINTEHSDVITGNNNDSSSNTNSYQIAIPSEYESEGHYTPMDLNIRSRSRLLAHVEPQVQVTASNSDAQSESSVIYVNNTVTASSDSSQVYVNTCFQSGKQNKYEKAKGKGKQHRKDKGNTDTNHDYVNQSFPGPSNSGKKATHRHK